VPSTDLLFELIDLLVEILDVIQQPLHEPSERSRQLVRAVLDQLRHATGDVRNAFGDDQAELGQQAPYLVGLCRPSLDEALADAVHGEHRLLLDILHRHEAHIRPTHGLADRLGIGNVVLVGLDVGLDELRSHRLDGMAQALELARPVVHAATCLDADQTRREVGEVRGNLVAAQLLPQDWLGVQIDAVDLEDALCQVEPNCRNVHDGRSSRFKWLQTLPLWHFDAVRVGASIPLSPPHRSVLVPRAAGRKHRTRTRSREGPHTAHLVRLMLVNRERPSAVQ
jgi:hypothetical protein